MASVFQVANYFLSKSEPYGQFAITHLKLQKLVYYAQAWTLVIKKDPLFPERIEAWIHGPVCPDLYYTFRRYGFDTIEPRVNADLSIFTEQEIGIMNAIWDAYGEFDGSYLEEMTHNEDPWKNARAGLNKFDQSNKVISLDSMLEYYGRFS